MQIQGQFYAEGSAAQEDAVLQSSNYHFTIETTSGHKVSGLIADLSASDRLGNVKRKLRLTDGSVFCTDDNDAVDKLLGNTCNFSSLLSRLEANLGLILIALVLTIAIGFSFFRWGVPAAGGLIAHNLPHSTNEFIAEGALDFLDKFIFQETEISAETQQNISNSFYERLASLNLDKGPVNYQLLFRKWGGEETREEPRSEENKETSQDQENSHGIANALALPSGQIILTDAFVKLAENQDEIDAVLLHEIAHVVHRHSLEMVVQGAILSIVVMLITGDNSAIADAGIGLGSLLVSSNYSRQNETEADRYAFEHMLKLGIDPMAFSNILNRMEASMKSERAITKGEESSSYMDYLMSHPSTEERSTQAEKFSECFQQGLRSCEIN